MCHIFANNSTKEVWGVKLYWDKEMTTDGKVIIITILGEFITLIDVICIIIPQKEEKGNRYIGLTYLYTTGNKLS